MRRWWLGALAVSVALAGCTGPDEESADSGQQGPTAYEKKIRRAADPEASAPAEPVTDAMNGGTITVLSSRTGPGSLTAADNGNALAIRQLVTRGLTQYQLRNGEPVLVPDLATDLGTPNKRRTRWEFTLRKGVTWENGDPVSSEDVARGIRELLDSPAGERYFGGSQSDDSEEAGDADTAVRTPDERTVVIRTQRPFGDLPHFVASPNLAAMPGDDEPDTLASGPYTVERLSSESAVLLRNENWDPETDPVRQQYPDKWFFDFNRKADEITDRVLEDGEQGQTTIVPDDLDPEQDQQVLKQAGDRAVTGPGRCVEVDYLDSSLPDPVRRALVAATPREVGSLLPEWTPGRKGAAEPKGDAVASKKLLEKSNALGTTLTLYEVDDEEGQARLQQARQAYEKAGFQVETEEISRSELNDVASGSEEPDEDVSLWPGEVCASWPSGGGLFPMVAQDGSGFPADAGLPKSIKRIERQPSEEALASWGELDQRLIDEKAVVVPTRNVPSTALVGSRIGHLRTNPVTGEPDYASVFLSD